jgi:cytochrome c biogenesis protein CcdA/thiol-disulfide isomerase/thioredoxin
MLLLIPFAFFAGIVTVLSPCILPVLPIVLSSSIGGGKQRPFGIVIGFIGSFTFFTLFLATLVQVLHISADAIRYGSILIVLLFGISLLVPQFQVLTERLFSKVSSRMSGTNRGTGFGSGLLIGLSLGLLWTPCVGPILASVISLALTGTVTGSAALITFAYALGTAIPLFAILYGGRNLLQKVPWLLRHGQDIQKVFGVVMIVTAAAIFFNLDRKFQTFILTTFPQYGTGLTSVEDNAFVRDQLKNINPTPVSASGDQTTRDMQETAGTPAPDLLAGGEWFNSPPLTIKSLRGKVVLIDFWTYTCINCIRTFPYLADWYTKYHDKGLVIIGVHTPEFEFEKNPANVRQALKDFNIKYPVMQDNDYATWKNYANHYWPAKYFIDKNGNIRATHFGEGNYAESEKLIQELLAETGQKVNVPINNKTYTIDTQSPETYVGYARLEYVAPPQDVSPDEQVTYVKPPEVGLNTFAYTGDWTVGSEFAMPQKDSGLVFHFKAKKMFLVMRPRTAGQTGKMRVYLDGKLVTAGAGADVSGGTVTINADRLYSLIELPSESEHTVRLEFLDDTLDLYAFTFG